MPKTRKWPEITHTGTNRDVSKALRLALEAARMAAAADVMLERSRMALRGTGPQGAAQRRSVRIIGACARGIRRETRLLMTWLTGAGLVLDTDPDPPPDRAA